MLKHRKTRNAERIFILILMLSALVAAGCRPAVQSAPPAAENAAGRPEASVLLLPFYNLSEIYGSQNRLRCPVCGQSHESGVVETDAVSIMNGLLREGMKANGRYRIIPSDVAKGSYSLFLADGGGATLHDNAKFLQSIDALGADYVMVGYIFRFRDRIGTRYSIKKPASIAFGLHLVDVKTGKIRWIRHYDETQASLSENLFRLGTFFRRGASWITAAEMADEAMTTILQELP